MAGWQHTSPQVFQAIKEQKAVLDRLTPNKAAAAELIGVRPSAVEGWCNVTTMNPNFPLALVSFHPAAQQLLEMHAYRIGYTLIPLHQKQALDGQLDDELRESMAHLGKVADGVQEALTDLQTPGKVDTSEAREIMKSVKALQKSLVQMVGELHGIIEDDDA